MDAVCCALIEAGVPVSPQMFYACMQKENFVNLLLKHIDTSAIMDLLLKFVACADSEILRTSITQVILPLGTLSLGGYWHSFPRGMLALFI